MHPKHIDNKFQKRLDMLDSFGRDGLIYSSGVILNYIEETSLKQREQCEHICSWFLDNKCANLKRAIEKITVYERNNHERSYPVKAKAGNYWTVDRHRKRSYTDKNQCEKNIAKALFRLSEENLPIRLYESTNPRILNDIGTVQDFEVPLFYPGKRNIDLISKVGKSRLLILELKRNHAKETLLRCILEAYTYSKICDRKILRDTFAMENTAKIVICPLIFTDSTAHEDLEDIDNRPNLRKLISEIEKADKEVAIRFAILDNACFQSVPDFGCKFDPKWLD